MNKLYKYSVCYWFCKNHVSIHYNVECKIYKNVDEPMKDKYATMDYVME